MQPCKINNASYSEDLFVSFAVHFKKNGMFTDVFVRMSYK